MHAKVITRRCTDRNKIIVPQPTPSQGLSNYIFMYNILYEEICLGHLRAFKSDDFLGLCCILIFPEEKGLLVIIIFLGIIDLFVLSRGMRAM